jgi:argininosuccinate lyase
LCKKPWGGRFKKQTDKLMEKFSESVSYDKRLYEQDIQGSIAHANMLSKTGIIKKAESEKIVKGLQSIKKEIRNGKFPFRNEFEDIHLNIEKRLIEKIGAVGGKLHTARSRNDQVLLDEKLYIRKQIGEINSHIKKFASGLIKLCEKNTDIIIPFYTHLQRAQPVYLSHYLLCYFEMIKRDRQRMDDCYKRLNVLPLGAGAGAGTSFPIDRNLVAKELGFPEISKNSIDTVSDRDFIIEFLSACSILMMHLSRMSEDFIIWSTKEFDYIDLGDDFTTGSSIMPQKKNPDACELIRGKVGRVYGNLLSIMTVMKGLPLSYNRDMQEDKEPLFDTIDTVKSSVELISEMIIGIKFKKEKIKSSLKGGFMTATDVADYLTKKGMPFRNAHEVAGKIVSYAEKKDAELEELTLDEYKKFSELFNKDIFSCITIEGSANSRTSYGGTAKKNVEKMIKECKEEVEKW